MKIIDINKYREKLTLKKKITLGVFLLIILTSLILFVLYVKHEGFRTWTDCYIFKKNIENTDIAYIEIDSSKNPKIFAYDKYITILEKNILLTYNSSGSKINELDVKINTPIYNSNGKYLCIAENKGNNIYMVSGDNILWQNSVDGAIDSINVNKNGYVSVVEKGTSYKNIIITYNPEGKEIFKTYLSTSMAIATDISDNNDYLAIAEVDTTGAIIQSNIKIISIEKAKTDPINSVKYSVQANKGDLITNIKYKDKNKLICIYDNSVHEINEGEDSLILGFEEKTKIADITNKDSVVYAIEKSSGIFGNSTEIVIKNIENNNEITYSVDGTIKTLLTHDNNIVINLGTEAEFINTHGWLKKKYNSTQEISEIVLGDSVAGIVYRDRIDIVNL